MKKTIAVITAISFLAGIIQAPLYAAAPVSAAEEKMLSIPVSAGIITGGKYFGSGEIIINIQDLHCHGEVQRNIAKIIADLDKKYNLKNVFLEGASGEVDTSFLSAEMKKEFERNAIESMVDMGYLNGVEYYSALKGKKEFIKGIEDENLYDENIGLLNEIMEMEYDVEKLCSDLIREMRPVKREYANKEARRLNRLVRKFEKGGIKADKFYKDLLNMAEKKGIDTDKYANIKEYSAFAENAFGVNGGKVTQQFNIFIGILKNKLPYKEFAELSEKSGSFANLEEISSELSALSYKYAIIEENRLYHLKNFFKYLEFGKKVNPLAFTAEEKALKDEMYSALGRTKYEKEVAFLSEFIPAVKGYFTANITAEELENFTKDFARFKSVWCSYFPENKAKHLDRYANLLRRYHDNNLKRDRVFSDILAGKNAGRDALKAEGKEALRKMGAEASGKNIKVVVTGGFHSSGLEKIFNESRTSYVIVTPKVTKDTSEAHAVYKYTMRGYRDIKASAINVKPFMKGEINVGLPKLVAASFKEFSRSKYDGLTLKEKEAGVLRFAEEFLSAHKAGNVEADSINIESYGKKKMVMNVVYKERYGNEILGEKKYEISGGAIIDLTDKSPGSTGRAPENLSVFDGLWKKVFGDVRSKGYGIITSFVVPVAEEFVFRYLPFAGAMLLTSNPLSAAALLITSAAGIGIFTFAHKIADDTAVKAGILLERRSANRIFFASAGLNIVFISFAILFPAALYIAFGMSVFLHAANNILAMRKKLGNPVLSLIDSIAKNANNFEDGNENDFSAKNLEPVLLEAQRNKKLHENLSEAQRKMFAIKDFVLEVPSESDTDRKIIYSKKLIDLLADKIGFTDAGASMKNLADSGETGRKIASEVIEQLFKKAEKTALPAQVRTGVLDTLNKVYMSLYGNTFGSEVLSIERINELFYGIGERRFLEKTDVYINTFRDTNGDSYNRDESYQHQLNYTRLISVLPQEILPRENVVLKTPVSFQISGKTDMENEKNKLLIENFESLRAILQLNVEALDLFKSIDSQDLGAAADSKLSDGKEHTLKTADKDGELGGMLKGFVGDSNENRALARRLLNGVMVKMTDEYKKIHVEHGKKAEESLRAMIRDFSSNNKYDFMEVSIGSWSAEDIGSIKTLHTLINAVHQSAIMDFKEKIRMLMRRGDDSEISAITASHGNTLIEGYNLSHANYINPEVKKLFMKLAQAGANIDGLTLKDDILMWTSRIGEHSVDIFFNFGGIDRGISINFHESGSGKGNERRLEYFGDTLRQLGFNSEVKLSKDKVSSLEAKINKDFGLNGEVDLVEVAAKTIMLFKYSKNLDYDLGHDFLYERKANLIRKFMMGEIWYGYFGSIYYSYDGDPGTKMGFEKAMFDKRVPNPTFGEAGKTLNRVLEYLGLPSIPNHFDNMSLNQNVLDQYFNNPVKDAFIEGKLVMDGNGNLIRNQEYNPMHVIADLAARKPYIKSLAAQSQMLNLIDYERFHLKSSYKIGEEMIGLQGYLDVNGGYVAITGVMDKVTRRMELAYTEFVDLDGVREVLNSKKLERILNRNGFDVKRQGEKSDSEINAAVKKMRSPIRSQKSAAELSGTGLASADRRYEPGFATSYINKADKKRILISPYITPDHTEQFEGAGYIVTSGAANSHANVVAREHGKAVISIKGTWQDLPVYDGNGYQYGKETYLVAQYNTASENAQAHNGFEIQALEQREIHIGEGTPLLMNGETGEILVFKSFSGKERLFENLYERISAKDGEGIKKIIDENKDSPDIEQILEYVYYSALGKSEYKELMDMLVNLKYDNKISAKVDRLKTEYAEKLYAEAADKLKSVKGVTNLISVRFTQVLRLEEDIKLLESLADVQQMKRMSREIKAFYNERKETFEKFCEYVEAYKKDVQFYISEGIKSEADLENAVRLLKRAAYWNNYYHYPGVEELAEELEESIETAKNRIRGGSPAELAPIESFDRIRSYDEDRFGAKATEVARYHKIVGNLAIDRIRVPHGYGVSANAVKLLLKEAGMLEKYEELFQRINEGLKKAGTFDESVKGSAAKKAVMEETNRYAREINSLIVNMDVDGMKDFISMLDEKLKGADPKNKLAVRSSSKGEDSVNGSFAGMGESVLNVSVNDVRYAVNEVIASFFQSRSLEYSQKLDEAKMGDPAVLIQNMVTDVKKSGAIITRDRNGNMVVESVYGISADMMKGNMTPDRLILKASGEGKYVRAVDNKQKLVAAGGEAGGIIKVDLSKEERTNRVMNDRSAVTRKITMAYMIEKIEEYPVEIEYAEESSSVINLLQVRPAKFYVIEGYDIKKDLHVDIGLSSGEVKKEDFITQVSWEDEPVPVYLKEVTGNTIVFSTTDKHSRLIRDKGFQQALFERLQDPKIMRKLPPFLVSKLKLKYKIFNVLPEFFDPRVKMRDVREKTLNTGTISRLLYAA